MLWSSNDLKKLILETVWPIGKDKEVKPAAQNEFVLNSLCDFRRKRHIQCPDFLSPTTKESDESEELSRFFLPALCGEMFSIFNSDISLQTTSNLHNVSSVV
jgi:hypothetical protein